MGGHIRAQKIKMEGSNEIEVLKRGSMKLSTHAFPTKVGNSSQCCSIELYPICARKDIK